MIYQNNKRKIKLKFSINKKIIKLQIEDKFNNILYIIMNKIIKYFINKKINKYKIILKLYMDKLDYNYYKLFKNN